VNTLYGTSANGGTAGYGTFFKINTDGTGFANVHSFSYPFSPNGGSTLLGSTVYGTVPEKNDGWGAVFAINVDGTTFTNLHGFWPRSFTYPYYNDDGVDPVAGLILSGSTLYGTAWLGGSSGNGTVFALKTDGTGFITLHTFSGGSDGANPSAGLILSGNTLYGTAYYGGSAGNGTVFSLSFRPQLTITPSGTNIILSWPTNVAGFDYTGYTLQSTTNLLSSAAWVTNSPTPVVAAGQNTVTNPITGPQQFFRLVH